MYGAFIVEYETRIVEYETGKLPGLPIKEKDTA